MSEDSGVGSSLQMRDGATHDAVAEDDSGCLGGHARFCNGQFGISVVDSQVQSSGESAPPHPPRVPGGLPTELTIMYEESSVRALPQAKSEPGKSRASEPPKSSSSPPPKTSPPTPKSRLPPPPRFTAPGSSCPPPQRPFKRPPPHVEAAGAPCIGHRRPNPVELHSLCNAPDVYSLVDRSVPLLEPAARREAKRARVPSPARRFVCARRDGARL